MSGRALTARALGTALATMCAVVGPITAVALGAAPARVQGRFSMRTVVTSAVNVRGEHHGERLSRTWRIRPSHCRRDVCRVLHLRRTRGLGRRLALTLRRGPRGTYTGRGAFFVALSCHGHLVRHGARAPYTIRLRVTATRTRGGVRFARRIAATYVNRRRIDHTRCLLEPSHDAARYSGRLRGGLPSPPRASFSPIFGAGGLVSFADSSTPGGGPGRRIVAWSWNFGDPASGTADGSELAAPTHQFSAAGTYLVALTAVDHAGLRATVQEPVAVPAIAPPPALRTPVTAPLRARRRAPRPGDRSGAGPA